jgi:dihydrofolate reductase
MGRIINSMFVSIDGVINHMEAWHFDYTDDEADQIASEQLLASDALLMGDLVPEASKLRQQSGDILMHGFGPVAQTLITNGLLDVLHLWVHPHFAGVGTPSDMLFSEGSNTRLELIGTRTLNSGIVILSYQVPETGRGSAPAAGR